MDLRSGALLSQRSAGLGLPGSNLVSCKSVLFSLSSRQLSSQGKESQAADDTVGRSSGRSSAYEMDQDNAYLTELLSYSLDRCWSAHPSSRTKTRDENFGGS